jgi:hypothetical protein
MSVFIRNFVFEAADGSRYAVAIDTYAGTGTIRAERHTGGYDTVAVVTFSAEGAREHIDTYWASAPVFSGGKTMAEVIAEAVVA